MLKTTMLAVVVCLFSSPVVAQPTKLVVDIPTRPGVEQRVLLLAPDAPKSAAILFAGGHGGLQIGQGGSIGWGARNFLVRSQKLFVDKGVLTVLIDAPSDRQSSPFLGGFRQRPMHVTDVLGVIAWLREKYPKLPVWLIGTSRGTQSAAFVATETAGKPEGPDGLVLTSTILTDVKARSVLEMPLEKLTLPVLVVHHKEDGCSHCDYNMAPKALEKLVSSRRKALISIEGGADEGDACEAMSHHGFNGQESDVVGKIVSWITAEAR